MSIDIFDVLNQLDRKSTTFLNVGSSDAAKETHTFLRYPALRWMSGATSNADHARLLEAVNEANLRWWSAKTPQLQAGLLAAAGMGRSVRHKWVAPPKGGSDDPLFAFVRAIEPDTNAKECTMFLNASTDEDLISLALRSGQYDSQSLSEFKKALKSWRKKQSSNQPSPSSADTAKQS